MSRKFKVIGSAIGFEGGRYSGDSPEQAARKAGHQLWRKVETMSEYKRFGKSDTLKFLLAETTKGSNKKTYSYKVKREKREKPTTVVLNGVTIVSNYTYKITACHGAVQDE